MLGHLVLGVSLTAGSWFLRPAVNDSLVMIDFIKQRLNGRYASKRHHPKGRFRPIFLTSATTFLAFTPLILEQAIQAQFFVPFAASLGVGVLVATTMLMVLVPALMAIYLRVNVELQSPVGRGHLMGCGSIVLQDLVRIDQGIRGLVIGSGILVLSGLFNRLLAVAALAGTFLGAGGLMSTRIVIQAMDGFTINQGIVAVFELTMVVIAFLLLRAAMRRATAPSN